MISSSSSSGTSSRHASSPLALHAGLIVALAVSSSSGVSTQEARAEVEEEEEEEEEEADYASLGLKPGEKVIRVDQRVSSSSGGGSSSSNSRSKGADLIGRPDDDK